ncbi:MAG: glutaredoxin family protein [Gammaproteobacteria bacterium]|nr:glutaredoxin family protein [Gammaproteobacteria bacterium]MBU1482458.1 glutaredoxin family protein [Gammaproteobacteria bacterium]
MKMIFMMLSLLLLTNAQAAELYRSIDKDGKVHYSDTPLIDSEDVERLKLGNEPVPDENLPYETRRAMQNFPVTLYTFPTCGSACQMARDLLNKRGIPFTEKSLVKQEDIDAFRKASGDSQMPAAAIGKTWLIGFLAEQWNNELDFAGYPKKNLSYRPAPAPRPETTPDATSTEAPEAAPDQSEQ